MFQFMRGGETECRFCKCKCCFRGQKVTLLVTTKTMLLCSLAALIMAARCVTLYIGFKFKIQDWTLYRKFKIQDSKLLKMGVKVENSEF